MSLSPATVTALLDAATNRQLALYSKLREPKFTPESYQHAETLAELMHVSVAIGELRASQERKP